MRRLFIWIVACTFWMLLFAIHNPGRTAFPTANVHFNISTLGNDTNGGGYYANGAQPNMSLYPRQNSAGCTSGVNCYSSTVDLSTNSASINAANPTVILCATCAYDANMINQVVYVSGGSSACPIASPQWRLVTNVVPGSSIAVDQAPSAAFLGTCTGITVNVGGSLMSPGQACNAMLNGQPPGTGIQGASFHLKNDGIYWITNPNQNTSGGPVNCTQFSALSTPGFNFLAGYNSTWNDWQTNLSNPPVIRVCRNATPPCTAAVNFSSVTYVVNWISGQAGAATANYTVDCNNAANARGIGTSANMNWNLTAENCPAGGLAGVAYAYNARSINSTPGMDGGYCLFCVISGSTNGPSVHATNTLVLGFSLIYGGSGSANHGVSFTSGSTAQFAYIFNNTIDGSGGDCINLSALPSTMVINNLLTNCAGKAINNVSGSSSLPDFFGYNAEYDNGGGANVYGPYQPGRAVNEITLSADPYVDRAASRVPRGWEARAHPGHRERHNYSTTSTSGVWCAGYPQTMPDGTPTCVDIGAIQHNPSRSGMLPGNFTDIAPGNKWPPELLKAVRLAFGGRRAVETETLRAMLSSGRTYDPTPDWTVFAGVILLLGVLVSLTGRGTKPCFA